MTRPRTYRLAFVTLLTIISVMTPGILKSPKGEALMASESESEISLEQKKEMLSIARQTVIEYLEGKPATPYKTNDEILLSKRGVFVSVYVDGNLRGCIGDIRGSELLHEGIRDKAVAASSQDHRFTPLEREEIDRLKIGISVLSPLVKVANADGIVMGKHGVIVSRGNRGGVFLPQVADKTGWSKEQFLSELCYQKAGLPPNAWKDKETDLFVFTAEEFDEENILSESR